MPPIKLPSCRPFGEGQCRRFQPWCTKKPQICARIVGVVELLLSFFGIIATVIMSMVVVDLEGEIIFIKTQPNDLNPTRELHQQVLQKDSVYTLVVKIETRFICDELRDKMVEYYEIYLKDTGVKIPPTEIISDKRPSPGAPFECIIHSTSKTFPYDNLKGKNNKRYSLSNIAALAIGQTISEDPKKIESLKLSVETPKVGRVEQKVSHPNKLGYDHAKDHCVNDVMRSNATQPEKVKELFEQVQNLLISSACISILSGILVMTIAYDPSPILLTAIITLEVVSVVLITYAIIYVNDGSLCLLELGGIGPVGFDSPKFIPTTVSCICGIYVVVFKGYTVLFIISYCAIAVKTPHFPDTISKSSLLSATEKKERISEVAQMVRRKNESMVEEELQGRLRKSVDEFLAEDGEIKRIFTKDEINSNKNSEKDEGLRSSKKRNEDVRHKKDGLDKKKDNDNDAEHLHDELFGVQKSGLEVNSRVSKKIRGAGRGNITQKEKPFRF